MFSLLISAFCLMSNHYHILVQTPAGNLSRAMRHINGVYTQRYNRRRSIDGQLFRGRYRSILVEEDSHLLELLRYIHRNPLRAQMCSTVDNYPWSSHKGYISSAKKWDWLYKDFLLGMLTPKKQKARRQYKEFVYCEDSDQITDFFNKKKLASFFGSQDFINWVKATYHQLQGHKEIPQTRQIAPTFSQIKELVCQCYEVEEQGLLQSERGQTNEPRNVAVYLARKKCGLHLGEIGREFGLKNYSSASSIVTRTEKQLSQNQELRDKIGRICLKVDKGHAKI